jgi:flagellar motility protein MotE (MotC chaperone)
MILVEHRALERRVIAMDGELRKALKEIKRLNKQMADLYSDAKTMGEAAEETESDAKPQRNRKQSRPISSIESMVARAWA